MKRIQEKIARYFAEQHKEYQNKQKERYQSIRHYPHCTQSGRIELDSLVYGNMALSSFNESRIGSIPSRAHCSECGKNEDLSTEGVQREQYEGIRHAEDLPAEAVQGIVECIGSAFGEAPGDTAEHINGDRIFLTKKDGKVIGFASIGFASPSELFALAPSGNREATQPLSSKPGVYLAAATVRKEHQGKDVFQRFVEQTIDTALREQRHLLSTRTQNPVLEKGIQTVLQQYVKDGAIGGYTLRRILVKGCYGQMLTTEKPRLKNRRDPLQGIYDSLDMSAGDAFILEFDLVPAQKGQR